jgi:hypothetical protein
MMKKQVRNHRSRTVSHSVFVQRTGTISNEVLAEDIDLCMDLINSECF